MEFLFFCHKHTFCSHKPLVFLYFCEVICFSVTNPPSYLEQDTSLVREAILNLKITTNIDLPDKGGGPEGWWVCDKKID